MAQTNSRKVNAVSTTTRILESIKKMNGAGITQISDDIGVSKTTVYNHLNTLRDDGYVIQDENNNYQIGLKFLKMSHAAKERFNDRDIIETEVDKLAEETGEIALYAVAEVSKSYMVYLAHGDQAIQTPFYEGYHTDLHTTAVGKSMLAFQSEEEIKQYITEIGLREVTENSITDKESLLNELQTIRDERIAFNREENILGLVGVGAPILDSENDAIGAISIFGPRSRMSGRPLDEEFPELLQRATNLIELNSTTP